MYNGWLEKTRNCNGSRLDIEFPEKKMHSMGRPENYLILGAEVLSVSLHGQPFQNFSIGHNHFGTLQLDINQFLETSLTLALWIFCATARYSIEARALRLVIGTLSGSPAWMAVITIIWRLPMAMTETSVVLDLDGLSSETPHHQSVIFVLLACSSFESGLVLFLASSYKHWQR